jgi:hypothetical protein
LENEIKEHYPKPPPPPKKWRETCGVVEGKKIIAGNSVRTWTCIRKVKS